MAADLLTTQRKLGRLLLDNSTSFVLSTKELRTILSYVDDMPATKTNKPLYDEIKAELFK